MFEELHIYCTYLESFCYMVLSHSKLLSVLWKTFDPKPEYWLILFSMAIIISCLSPTVDSYLRKKNSSELKNQKLQ